MTRCWKATKITRTTKANGVSELQKSSNQHVARRLPALQSSESRQRKLVSFTFDDQLLQGYEGEPVAVALLGAGVRVFRAMPEAGEQRGGFCFAGRCADCLVVVNGQNGVRACVTPLAEGMRVQTQHGLGMDMPEANQ